jgi:hypothetical protein
MNAGYVNVSDYRDAIHPYRRHKKEHCENRDGRLGFVCTSTITHKCMLHGDHIDGNPSNNDESNIQTLCLCCHAFKTITHKDYLTPGRKTLGVTY